MQAKSAPHRSIAVAKGASPPYVGRHDGKTADSTMVGVCHDGLMYESGSGQFAQATSAVGPLYKLAPC